MKLTEFKKPTPAIHKPTLEEELREEYDTFSEKKPPATLDETELQASLEKTEAELETAKLQEEIRTQFEAAYDGNIGIMELMKFYKEASKPHVDLLKRLIAADKTKEAWQLIQKVTGTELVGKEFNEDLTEAKGDVAVKYYRDSKNGWPSFIGVNAEGDRMCDPFHGRNGTWDDLLGKLPRNWKEVQVTPDDIAAGRLYVQWDKAPKSKLLAIAEKFLQLNISKMFKKIPRTLYRGFALTPEQEKKLKAGKKLKLNKTVASSWSTEKDNAQTFTGAKQGVIIKRQFKMSDVICHLELLDEMFRLPLSDRWMGENEVLINGNGIGNYLDPTVEKLEFANFYSEDVTEGVGLIRKGSNVTPDVGEGQTRIEAEKLGFTVTDDGVPPIPKNGVPKLYEGVLTELNMAPGRLQKEVYKLVSTASPQIGLEFEVIFPVGKSAGSSDPDSNPDIAEYTTMDDIQDFFGENSGSDFDDINDSYAEWIDKKGQDWTDNEIESTMINPSYGDEHKVEFMVDEYVTSGDADEIIERINEKQKAAGIEVEDPGEITSEIAKEVLKQAHERYKVDGEADGWPVDVKSPPYMLLYHEIFIVDDSDARQYFSDKYSDRFYEDELQNGSYEYSVGSFLLVDQISDMAQVFREWEHNGLIWPGGYSGGYGGGTGESGYDLGLADEIVNELGELGFNAETHDPNLDHDVDYSVWTVTSDDSIKAEDDESGMEIITPIMDYEDGIEDIKKFMQMLDDRKARANKSTGLHINVSMDNISHDNVDYAKLVLLLGDKHILKQFNREFNEYALDSITQLRAMMDVNQSPGHAREQTGKSYADMLKNMKSGMNNVVGNAFTSNMDFGKYASVGIKGDRIEFRAAGGENYLDDVDEIIKLVNRFVVAYAIAADKDAYKKEYGKKLYKLASSVGEGTADKASMTLFAGYASGIITKEDLIKKLKAKRGTKDDNKEKATAKEHYPGRETALLRLAEIHGWSAEATETAWMEALKIEAKRTYNQEKAVKLVYNNLIDDPGHYHAQRDTVDTGEPTE